MGMRRKTDSTPTTWLFNRPSVFLEIQEGSDRLNSIIRAFQPSLCSLIPGAAIQDIPAVNSARTWQLFCSSFELCSFLDNEPFEPPQFWSLSWGLKKYQFPLSLFFSTFLEFIFYFFSNLLPPKKCMHQKTPKFIRNTKPIGYQIQRYYRTNRTMAPRWILLPWILYRAKVGWARERLGNRH